MGVYVQENKFELPVTFSGPWAHAQVVTLNVMVQNGLVSLYFPAFTSLASISSIITGVLPSNLAPEKLHTQLMLIVANSATDVSHTTIDHDGLISINNNTSAFPASGQAGWFGQYLVPYQI